MKKKKKRSRRRRRRRGRRRRSIDHKQVTSSARTIKQLWKN